MLDKDVHLGMYWECWAEIKMHEKKTEKRKQERFWNLVDYVSLYKPSTHIGAAIQSILKVGDYQLQKTLTDSYNKLSNQITKLIV